MSASSDRYLRHDLIDWFSQTEVKAARIAVVGAGAIGNEVVKNLALLGVGQIDVYDFDTVEIHNLTRSVLLRESDLGRPKAACVVERAAELDPNCRLRAMTGDVRDTLNPGSISMYSAVISAVDNFDARLRLNQLCLLASVDFINAAIDSRFVSLETFPHSRWDIACYECHLPDSTYQRIAERYSCGGLMKRAFEERKVPTTAITASLAGAMAAAAALGLGDPANKSPGARRVFLDSHTMLSQASSLMRQSACPACSGLRSRPKRIELADLRLILKDNEAGRSTAVFQEHGSDDSEATFSEDSILVVLPEPVITGYRCAQCGGNQGQGLGASDVIGHRARQFDDRLSWCPNCKAASMQIELRERFGLAELEQLSAQMAMPHPPAAFAIAHYHDQSGYIEWNCEQVDHASS